MAPSLIIIAHNIRSTHNVGSLLRTAEGLGVAKLYITGYTPYPKQIKDKRLPHIAEKIHSQIHKTALGAEELLPWQQSDAIHEVIVKLKKDGYTIAGLEQTPESIQLPKFQPPQKLAILLGSEVTGIDTELLNHLDYCLEIPMSGKKESFNVVEAASMAMYHCLQVAVSS
ncbi:MAG: TrmH family RNA methyltransferase [Candidatus Saccharimonadales bacterium]